MKYPSKKLFRICYQPRLKDRDPPCLFPLQVQLKVHYQQAYYEVSSLICKIEILPKYILSKTLKSSIEFH